MNELRLQELQKTIEFVDERDNDLVKWLTESIESSIAYVEFYGVTESEEIAHFENLALLIDILEMNGVYY